MADFRDGSQLHVLVTETLTAEQRPAQEHMTWALPGQADPAVQLDTGLAHISGALRGIGLRGAGSRQCLGRVEHICCPGAVPRAASRTLYPHRALGRDVLQPLDAPRLPSEPAHFIHV